jgi:predicted membrane channel-forming protein YqfA (hemolysin III family)
VKRRYVQAAKATGSVTAISVVGTMLDPPSLAVVVLVMIVLVVSAVCWVVADPTRARSLALLIYVTLGGDRRLPPE